MLNGVGFIIILVCVFGSFILGGDKREIILHALPHELTAIVGYAQSLPVEVAIEIARRMMPSAHAPSFQQLETALDKAKNGLTAQPA